MTARAALATTNGPERPLRSPWMKSADPPGNGRVFSLGGRARAPDAAHWESGGETQPTAPAAAISPYPSYLWNMGMRIGSARGSASGAKMATAPG